MTRKPTVKRLSNKLPVSWPQVFSSRLDGGFVMYWSTLAELNNVSAPHLRDFEFRLPLLSAEPAPHVTATVFADDKQFVGGAYSVSLATVNMPLNSPPEISTQVRVRAEAPPGGARSWVMRCNLVVIARPARRAPVKKVVPISRGNLGARTALKRVAAGASGKTTGKRVRRASPV